MRLNLSLIFLTLLAASCASYDHVRPGADGVHHVLIRGTDKTEVETQAIEEANDFCGEKDQKAAFVQEDTKYTGSMKESTHKAIKKISEAAQVGGSMATVFGGKKESNAGKTAVLGGVVGETFQDNEAYTADMKFKCI